MHWWDRSEQTTRLRREDVHKRARKFRYQKERETQPWQAVEESDTRLLELHVRKVYRRTAARCMNVTHVVFGLQIHLWKLKRVCKLFESWRRRCRMSEKAAEVGQENPEEPGADFASSGLSQDRKTLWSTKPKAWNPTNTILLPSDRVVFQRQQAQHWDSQKACDGSTTPSMFHCCCKRKRIVSIDAFAKGYNNARSRQAGTSWIHPLS